MLTQRIRHASFPMSHTVFGHSVDHRQPRSAGRRSSPPWRSALADTTPGTETATPIETALTGQWRTLLFI